MSTASLFPFSALPLTATPQLPPMTPRPIMRRSTPQQGVALEVLGHAIEYLVDSRLPEGGADRSDAEAIRLLMCCSRAVFEECSEIVPMRRRLSAWLSGQLRRSQA